MYYQRPRTKYGNKTKEYNGRTYHSHLEAKYAQELDLMLKAGEIKEVKPQHRVSLDVNGYHICNYIVDFLVTNNDDTQELWEIKGFQTDLFNFKWKLTEALYGKQYKLVLIK